MGGMVGGLLRNSCRRRGGISPGLVAADGVGTGPGESGVMGWMRGT